MFDDNDFSKFSNVKVKYFILKTQALEKEFDKNTIISMLILFLEHNSTYFSNSLFICISFAVQLQQGTMGHISKNSVQF